ncbi:MAG: phosphotransferase [Lachnospiraceae bacterium]|nr:phosphotransferase [Lachnospiraceae bacterium]
MEELLQKIKQELLREYGLEVCEVHQMTAGVGGDTYKVQASQGKFIYKIADANDMNHPEAEPQICEFLLSKGIPVCNFVKNHEGSFITWTEDKKVSHLQSFIEGKVFPMNSVPEWFMVQAPILLGRIHNALREYKELPIGIGADFFKYMTPDNARQSYLHSYENAKQSGQVDIQQDLEIRLKVLDKMVDWRFDLERLTYCNTHGDYTVNQVICRQDRINAVIDWTCACRHPVIWEITRSFFLAEPTCAYGELEEAKFKDYVEAYCSVAPLTQYDKDNFLKLYYYQLAVCDYYAQYFGADDYKKEEYLSQAKFATKVLQHMI